LAAESTEASTADWIPTSRHTGALGTVYKQAVQLADGDRLDDVIGPLEIPGVLRASSVLIYPSTMVTELASLIGPFRWERYVY